VGWRSFILPGVDFRIDLLQRWCLHCDLKSSGDAAGLRDERCAFGAPTLATLKRLAIVTTVVFLKPDTLKSFQGSNSLRWAARYS
jgi:hypothetical protein